MIALVILDHVLKVIFAMHRQQPLQPVLPVLICLILGLDLRPNVSSAILECTALGRDSLLLLGSANKDISVQLDLHPLVAQVVVSVTIVLVGQERRDNVQLGITRIQMDLISANDAQQEVIVSEGIK